eukprot:scaffold98995_cov19-Prasinocladus_malaysianus.AAC.1
MLVAKRNTDENKCQYIFLSLRGFTYLGTAHHLLIPVMQRANGKVVCMRALKWLKVSQLTLNIMY